MTNNAPGTLTVRNALIFNGTTFAAEEDAIRLANASEYGLASYV